MTEPRKRSSGCLWVVLFMVVLVGVSGILVVGGLFALGRSAGTPSLSVRSAGVDEFPRLKEVWSEGAGTTKVVRIPLSGMIMLGEESGFFASNVGSADAALRAIFRATKDPEVKAIVMDIDSGGGGITASDIIYKALQDFRKAQEGRVVMAVFNDVAASGAYYVALAADHIVAHPTTITGSIGVLVQSMNVKELAQKIGIRDVTIKSGDNKDLMNPFNEMSPEQREMLQGVVDDFHNRFVRLVAEGRDLPEQRVRELADGRIYTATAAMDLGLVDEIGYWSDAVAKTAELLDVDKVRVLRYEKEMSFSSLFRGMEQQNPMSKFLQSFSRTRLMYLWEL